MKHDRFYTPLPPAPWHIALTANIKEETEHLEDEPPDYGAEFDSQLTVEAIANAMRSHGHKVTICVADRRLPAELQEVDPDIVFNIAEGIGGDAREAQVPAICEMLGIPYTASRVLANALSLDKAHTKRIWRHANLPTPRFQEFRTGDEPILRTLRYPLFVKPAREGTGMGIGPESVVHNGRELRRRVRWVIDTYRQPALVEEFLSGREFTVGYIGNTGYESTRLSGRFSWTGYCMFPVLEIDTSDIETAGIYGREAKSIDVQDESAPGYLCPADISDRLREQLQALTIRAADAIGARDVSRVDFRLDDAGQPYLLEINTLPGLNREQSDLCIMARALGMTYTELITEILYIAAARWGYDEREAAAAADSAE
jgi:D-alanine-D-alanine ligase